MPSQLKNTVKEKFTHHQNMVHEVNVYVLAMQRLGTQNGLIFRTFGGQRESCTKKIKGSRRVLSSPYFGGLGFPLLHLLSRDCASTAPRMKYSHSDGI